MTSVNLREPSYNLRLKLQWSRSLGGLQTDFCVESINKSAGDIPGTAAAIIEHLNLNVPTSDIGYTKQTNMVNTLL